MGPSFLQKLRARLAGAVSPGRQETLPEADRKPSAARSLPEASVSRTQPEPADRCVWFHAGGEGEAITGIELFRRLREEDESLRCILTTTGVSPVALATPDVLGATEIAVLPEDAPREVSDWLENKAPDVLIWTGAPSHAALLQKAQQRGVMMILAESPDFSPLPRRRKDLRGALTRTQLRRFGYIFAASEESARIYEQLGAPRSALRVTGALEEGCIHLAGDDLVYRNLSHALAARPVWLAARTTEEEEALLADVHRRVIRMSHRLLLIVVPDDPERMESSLEAFRAKGWLAELHTARQMPSEDTQVLIGAPDDLGLWYRLSPITFMGGTLSGAGGAHPFAPATLGSAILYGNFTEPFQSSYGKLVRAGAARLVLNADGLEVNLRDLQAADKVAQMAHAAWEICSRGAEVTDLLVEQVFEGLDTAGADNARA